MFKKLSLFFGLCALVVTFVTAPAFGRAQTTTNTTTQNAVPVAVNAGIDRTAAVDRPVLFEVDNPSADLVYEWSFGDQSSTVGQIVSHTYSETGNYTVTLTVTDSVSGQSTSDSATVAVLAHQALLIGDRSITVQQRQELAARYARQNVLLVFVTNDAADPSYIVEENLATQLVNDADDLGRADLVISWTEGTTGLSALSKAVTRSEASLDGKGIVNVGTTTKSFARVAQATYDQLHPEYILLITESGYDQLVGLAESQELLTHLSSSDAAYRVVGSHSARALSALRPWNSFSYVVNYMINHGVPESTVILLLMLPVVATLVAFAKQIIGFKGFGIYTPTIITMAFLATGLVYGLLIFALTLLAGTLVRFLMRRLRLLYVPRIAIILSAVSLTIVGILAFGAQRHEVALSTLAVFPILILVSLVEKFVNAQIENGVGTALRLSMETLILSVVGYFVVSWDGLRVLILAYPEIILITLVINFVLGRWTGLRLSEYLRFREIRRYLKG